MKILWIVNTIFPYPSEQLGMKKNVFGGWLIGLAEKLKENKKIKLAIATVYDGKEIKKFKNDNIIYYLIPGRPAIKYHKSWERDWKKINEEFQPDLVHIHGSEFLHGLAFVNACPEQRVIIAIQGLTSVCSEVYYGNISASEIIRNVTIRDILRRDTIFKAKRKMQQRGESERELIHKSNYVIGRTMWDYANTKMINPNIKYYFLNETLRKGFYNKEWDINKIERHSIFIGQAWYPIKGLHIALKAIKIIKSYYPDVKLYVAGNDFVTIKTFKDKLRQNGYSKYLNKLIKKYDLKDNVVFTGILSEEEMVDRFLKSNVFVCPSIIENESNALSEAAIMGVPAVCSYVGGIPDRITHGINGFLYPFTEYAMLAEYILRYFQDDQLCIEHGKKAKEEAEKRNNPEQNLEQVIKIYNEIIQKGE